MKQAKRYSEKWGKAFQFCSEPTNPWSRWLALTTTLPPASFWAGDRPGFPFPRGSGPPSWGEQRRQEPSALQLFQAAVAPMPNQNVGLETSSFLILGCCGVFGEKPGRLGSRTSHNIHKTTTKCKWENFNQVYLTPTFNPFNFPHWKCFAKHRKVWRN